LIAYNYYRIELIDNNGCVTVTV